jgi:tetratricopeptide (TPR) repeat protein
MFNKIDIPVALPAGQKEALTTLYLLQGYAYTDMRDKYIKPLDEYLSLYPESYEGYLMHAEYTAIADSAFERAQAEWNKALKITDKPDDVHYNISKVYTAILARTTNKDEQQALLDSAIVNVNKAIEIKPEALYIQHCAELLYAKGDYATSFEHYIRLSQTNMGGTDAFVAASRCKEMLEEWDAAIIYMDSAVNSLGSDSLTAAPYIINRAMLKERAKRYREAVLDYNTYATLREGQLNANFYYCREQAEYEAKMYKQALDDIEMALYLQPDELLFLIEKGRLCYRVKLIDEAITSLTRATEIANDNPDAYYMLARCYMVKGDKAAAKENMQRANELGHYDANARLQEIDAIK